MGARTRVGALSEPKHGFTALFVNCGSHLDPTQASLLARNLSALPNPPASQQRAAAMSSSFSIRWESRRYPSSILKEPSCFWACYFIFFYPGPLPFFPTSLIPLALTPPSFSSFVTLPLPCLLSFPLPLLLIPPSLPLSLFVCETQGLMGLKL